MGGRGYLLETLECIISNKLCFLNKEKDFSSLALNKWLEHINLTGNNAEENLQFSKEVFTGHHIEKFMAFCLNDDEISKEVFDSDFLEYRDGDCFIKYSVHNGFYKHREYAKIKPEIDFEWLSPVKNRRYDMSLLDLSQYSDSVVMIHTFVNCSEKSSGARTLKKFCDTFGGTLILLEAGFIFAGQYSKYYTTGDDSVLSKLELYYNKQGFQNVNSFIGCYEEKVTMVNYNGSDFLKNVEKLEEVEGVALRKLDSF